jgi:lipopolysaccharide export system protein LptA
LKPVKRILSWALLTGAIFFPANSWLQEGKIKLLFAETVSDYKDLPNTTKAVGNVQFEHNRTKMFCDSAIFFQDENLMHAYGHVQINQGDTVNLFCDSLKYDGNTKISKLWGNVRFRDNEYKLLTDSLEYDGNLSRGYYKNYATISSIEGELKLVSKKGYYYSDDKTFFFKDSVHVTHPQYELFSDTLEFRTIGTSAHFHGPTVIYMDSSEVHCNTGVYFTEKEFIQLWNGATIVEPNRTLYADSLLYNQKTDLGEGFCNVRLYDSTEKVMFLSDYLLKYPNNEQVTLYDNAHVVQFGEKDTLFLSADTIYNYDDTLSDFRRAVAIQHVEIINGKMFVACDSAYFSERDSLIKLHKAPMMWADSTQLSADSVHAVYYNQEFHKLLMYNNAFITSEKDSIHYDQIKGEYMTAWLDSSRVQRVYIETNAQTLYYVTEDQTDTLGNVTKSLTGQNKIDCNAITVYFVNSDVENITFHDQPTGAYNPIEDVPQRELFLTGFLWQIERKPKPIFVE